MGDIQVAAEYVVAALRTMVVDALTHGGLAGADQALARESGIPSG